MLLDRPNLFQSSFLLSDPAISSNLLLVSCCCVMCYGGGSFFECASRQDLYRSMVRVLICSTTGSWV